MPRFLSIFAVAAVCFSSTAFAQDKALAEQLFTEGTQLMDAGKPQAACPKLEQSQQLDPAGGTALALGFCYEATGRTATAWQTFKDSIAFARRDGSPDREKMAADHAAALEPKLSHLVVNVAPAVAALPGFEVQVDQSPYGSALWGAPAPLDPGPHRVSASAPEYETAMFDVVLGKEADTETVQVSALVPAPATAAQAPAAGASGTSATGPVQKVYVTNLSGKDRGLRVASYVTGAVGIAAIGVGSFFGVRALSKNGSAKAACPDSPCTSRAGVDDAHDAQTFATVADVGVGVGIVALGVATYLFFASAPDKAQATTGRAFSVDPVIATNGGGAVLSGAF